MESSESMFLEAKLSSLKAETISHCVDQHPEVTFLFSFFHICRGPVWCLGCKPCLSFFLHHSLITEVVSCSAFHEWFVWLLAVHVMHMLHVCVQVYRASDIISAACQNGSIKGVMNHFSN